MGAFNTGFETINLHRLTLANFLSRGIAAKLASSAMYTM